jgi:hypothetical protein
MTLPSAWAGLPALSGLAVNTERNGVRHWTECTQSSSIMAVHNWNPAVPVTDAERDALDATPPHKPLTGTTVRERDACLVARYGWAGLRAGNFESLYRLLAGGSVATMPGQGDYPAITDFTGPHGLAIGPAARGAAWVRDPLHEVGHWAPWSDIVSWCWGADQCAIYPTNDPNMIAELQPLLGVGVMQAPIQAPEPARGTTPPMMGYQPQSEALPLSVAQAPVEIAVAGGPGVNWTLVTLAALVAALAIMGRKETDSEL